MINELNLLKECKTKKSRITIERNIEIDILIKKMSKFLNNPKITDKKILELFINNSIKLLSVDEKGYEYTKELFLKGVEEVRNFDENNIITNDISIDDEILDINKETNKNNFIIPNINLFDDNIKNKKIIEVKSDIIRNNAIAYDDDL